MDIIGQNWIRFENNRKVKYRCSRSDFIVSGRFFDRGTWNYPEERFGRIENPLYFCTRRDGRVVDCGGLENRCAARLRGFESLSLRDKAIVKEVNPCKLNICRDFFLSHRYKIMHFNTSFSWLIRCT